MRTSLVLFTILLCTALAPVDANETRAAAVLFDNFETVFHTVPALLLGTRGDVGVGFAQEPFGYLLFAFDKIGKEVRTAVFADSQSVLLGTKDYRPPDGLGRVVATRCYVIVLRKRNTVEISKYFDKFSVVSDRGTPIWAWSADIGEFGDRGTHLSSLYATQVTHTYVVVSNNLEELKTVSNQLASSDEGAMPPRIREWDDVRKHEFWGYRKYRLGQDQQTDPIFTGMRGIEPDADALILYVDLIHDVGVLRLLSSNTENTTANSLSSVWKIPPLTPSGQEEWETKFPLKGPGPYSESSFKVLWLFGLGVVV